MDYRFTDEQLAFRRSVKEFAQRVVAPGAEERDRLGEWDPAIWRALSEFGLAGLPVPAEYGGSGADIITSCLANEALAEGGGDGGLNLSLGAHWVIGSMPIALHGTEEQKQRYLPRLASGEWVGAWASTEPEAGSDAGAVKARGRRDGDAWVLNGTKTFITNGSIAGLCNVLVRTQAGAEGGAGLSCFIVETSTPGYRASRDFDKHGCRSSPTSEVVLDDCRVPAENLLGAEGEALWRIAFECFDWERTVMVAASIGSMQGVLDTTIAYAKQRVQFGKPIARHPVIAHKIAGMKIDLEVMRNAVYRAAWMKQENIPHQIEASIAKYLVGDLSTRIATEAVQIHGGYGYMREFGVERALRDTKLASIGGGTSEIQKLVISRMLLAD
ncbi:MAG: acyl-CoA dehydrogenase family protein [Actinomycetota bacterium]